MTVRLPQGVVPFVSFATVLRDNGFAVAPEQTQALIAAVGLLGPKSMQDIYRAAMATLSPGPDRREEFDALYRMHFLGHTQPAVAEIPADEEDVKAFDDRDGEMEPPQAEEIDESGAEATGAERLSLRQFSEVDETAALLLLRRSAAGALPRRKSRRMRSSNQGSRPDLRRTLREAVKRDGESIEMPMLRRRTQQRRILLLIDVSGSMKEQTDSYMRFAHAMAAATDRLEVFTLGTRLTRVTRAMRLRNRDQALAIAGSMVADWDGGTRLGEALATFLGVPRFAGFARGAFAVVLSDGLERGDHTVMAAAMERLSRLAWKVLWLSPLAASGNFEPQTEALVAIRPFVSRFGRGASVSHLCDEVLAFARVAA